MSEETLRSDEKYLSGKRAQLASPGIKLTDCYYTAINSQVDSAEVTYNLGRYNVSLSQLAFGGTSQLIIPNGSLLSNCYLHLVLPPILPNQTLSKGWSWSIISQLNFLIGSSNAPQVYLSGASMWTAILAQCETSEKANEYFLQGGNEYTNPTTGNVEGNILLELPFSNACGAKGKKPIDTQMLNNPVTISITFNQANTIYGGTAPMPAGFVVGNLISLQGNFANPDQSLNFPLRANPSLMLSYPWIYKQSFTPPPFTGSTSLSAPVTLNLQSFINADLVSLYFYVVQNSYLYSTNGSTPSPFLCDPITNINLTYNGLVLYYAPGNLYQLVNCRTQEGAAKFSNSLITSVPGLGVAPYISTPYECYMVQINFSKLRADCIGDHMMNTLRVGNNSLNISFNTSTSNQYQAFATYCYNSVVEFSNGSSAVYF
jgi:hypothetical protein